MLKFAFSADAVCPSVNWDIETTVILHNDAFFILFENFYIIKFTNNTSIHRK